MMDNSTDVRILDIGHHPITHWLGKLFADNGSDVTSIYHQTEYQLFQLAATLPETQQKNILLDMNQRQACDLIRSLACNSDVIFISQTIQQNYLQLLSYQTLVQFNPQLIYCVVDEDDQFISSTATELPLTIHDDFGQLPVLPDLQIVMLMAKRLQALLTQHNRTSRYIEFTSWIETATTTSSDVAYLQHPHLVGYRIYPTADGYLVLAATNDQQFVRLCEALNCNELISDPRFITNWQRLKHHQQLLALLMRVISKLTTDVCLSLLTRARVPCSQIKNLLGTQQEEPTLNLQMDLFKANSDQLLTDDSGSFDRLLKSVLDFEQTKEEAINY